jgi:hypothetical protein
MWQGDAVLVPAPDIDNLTGRDQTVGFQPIAPATTVGSGLIGDLFAVAVPCYWQELRHHEPPTIVETALAPI